MLSSMDRMRLTDLSRVRRNKKLMTVSRIAEEILLKEKAGARDQARIYGVIFHADKKVQSATPPLRFVWEDVAGQEIPW